MRLAAKIGRYTCNRSGIFPALTVKGLEKLSWIWKVLSNGSRSFQVNPIAYSAESCSNSNIKYLASILTTRLHRIETRPVSVMLAILILIGLSGSGYMKSPFMMSLELVGCCLKD